MRRLRHRFNEQSLSFHDVERHIMKNISRDYKDVAEYIIDEVGIDEVIEGFFADNLGLIDVIYYEDALKICKQHSGAVMEAWLETNGNELPRRTRSFIDLATQLASNLYYVVTGQIYGIIGVEFDVEELESLV